MGQEPVHPVRKLCLALLAQKALLHDLFNKIVFLVDDPVLQIHILKALQSLGIPLPESAVLLQELKGRPAQVPGLRILLPETFLHPVDLVLHLVGIHHGVFAVMVMPVPAVLRILVIVDQGIRGLLLLMMDHCMHQDLQAPALSGGHGDHRRSQHLRKTVQVDLHTPLLHDVHHVQGDDHGLPQLQKLQGQIKVSFQGRCVHHVDDHIHLIRKDVVPGDLLLHGVGGQGIGPRQIHKADLLPLEAEASLHLLHGHTGPVCHLQLCSGIGVEQGGLSTVGISDKCYGDHKAVTSTFSVICLPRANLVPRIFTTMVPPLLLFMTSRSVPLVMPSTARRRFILWGSAASSTLYKRPITPLFSFIFPFPYPPEKHPRGICCCYFLRWTAGSSFPPSGNIITTKAGKLNPFPELCLPALPFFSGGSAEASAPGSAA